MVKNPSANAGDTGLIPELGRSPREGNGNLLQHSCLGNPMNRAWRSTAHVVTKESDTDLATNQQQSKRHMGQVCNFIWKKKGKNVIVELFVLRIIPQLQLQLKIFLIQNIHTYMHNF